MADDEKRRLRALAFGGGAFDTIMQMGVVHALLVSRGQAPDHVVGISAGAVNAAALGEVLQAGEGLPPEQRLAARVHKLRGFLDAYADLPRTFANSALPDAFEVNAKRALKPLELPIHLPDERRSRAEASRGKAGLIRLFNHLLSIRLSVGRATRIVRRIFAIRQADEQKRPCAAKETVIMNAIFLWIALGRSIGALTGVFSPLLSAVIAGPHRSIPLWFFSHVPRALNAIKLKRVADWLTRHFRNDAATAGEAIQFHLWRSILHGSRITFGFLLLLVLWAAPLLLISPPRAFVKGFENGPLTATPAHIEESASALGKALVRLPAMSPAAFAEDVAGVADELFNTLADTGLFLFDLAWRYRVTLLGVGLPLILALLTEMFFYKRAGYVVLGVWVVAIALYNSIEHGHHMRSATIATAVLAYFWVRARRDEFRRRILAHFDIHDGLLSTDVLRQAFVACFDVHYFGRGPIEAVIEAALKKSPQIAHVGSQERVPLGKYRAANPPIHVAPVAANADNGHLEILGENVPIVDALLASTAVLPFFPAQKLVDQWYIDGLNVSNEPIQPLFRFFREDYKRCPAEYANVKTVDIYPVSDVPVDEPRLEQKSEYSTLVDVGLRAMELKNFRDAAMERRLTRLYTRSLPSGEGVRVVDVDGEKRPFIHAGLFPIELEKPARVNRRLFHGANADDYKRILRETVADGCRASLEAMVPRVIAATAAAGAFADWLQCVTTPQNAATIEAIHKSPRFPFNIAEAEANAAYLLEDVYAMPFPDVVKETVLEVAPHDFVALQKLVQPRCKDVIANMLKQPYLPGSDRSTGPGLSEICRNCRLNRPDPKPSAPKAETQNDESALSDSDRQRLRFIAARAEDVSWPQWPLEDKNDARPMDLLPQQEAREKQENGNNLVQYDQWKFDRSTPSISFLFGGGVFRGVFHMGVMNALSEAGIQPNIVAGSSVGSIVAAMIASVFKVDGEERHRRIARLAATFLAIDRLVLTDRLAEFIRRFTLRAAEARFSPRDLDRTIRQFDADASQRFVRRVRRVAAGMERLFYLSPFELFDLVRDVRMQQSGEMWKKVIADVQELLERGGLGQEILGSESLSLLIHRHVLDCIDSNGSAPQFQSFLEKDPRIFFFATATNLSDGALEILGAPWSAQPAVFAEFGLLASSAFPAVFRPRQSWEIFPRTREDKKYIDGGTIDNLPLDAVARFLHEASQRKCIERRLAAPHLLFTASLEVSDRTCDEVDKLENVARDWMELGRRARTFKYNRKLDAYVSVQERLRAIHKAHGPQKKWEPLDLHVLAVKPNWLCNTFGMHPMLGFRRRKQAQSIAHGCATTLVALAKSQEKRKEWWKLWGHRPVLLAANANPEEGVYRPQKVKKKGDCWFRQPGSPCPFSKQATKGKGLSEVEVRELHKIYTLCGERKTHEPER